MLDTPRTDRALSPAVVRLLVATVLNAVGNGVAFPFLFVYFHEVRGFASYRTGLILATTGLVTLVVNVVGGSLVDRIGPRRQFLAAVALQAAGFALYIAAHHQPVAFAGSVLNGAGFGLFLPASGSLTTSLSDPSTRSRLSAYSRAALNLGMGIGGVLGGFIADKHDPATYTRLFTFDIATFAVFAALVSTVRPPAAAPSDGDDDLRGYRSVLADRFFVRLLVADLSIAMGFSFAFEIMPGFASAIGVRERVIGLVFLANTLTIVAVQVPSVRLFKGRNRLHWLARMNLLFAIGFVLLLLSVERSLVAAGALLFVAQLVFGFGECVLGAVRQPLTADLAPPALVGRYYGLAGMAFQAGMVVGKALGGWLLGVDHRLLWSTAIAVTVVGAIGTHRLDRRIHPELRFAPA